MGSNTNIEQALADLETQKVPNFSATAQKYHVVRSTLTRRFYCQSTSREDAVDMHHRCLTRAQENALVALINRLTDRGLPPTPQIVTNLAVEIRGAPVGKN